jgi:hypothetical protein
MPLQRGWFSLNCALGRGVLASAAPVKSGRLAQLVERLVYTEDVGSSSLSSPTILSIFVQMPFNPLKARRFLVFENDVFDGLICARKMQVLGLLASS